MTSATIAYIQFLGAIYLTALLDNALLKRFWAPDIYQEIICRMKQLPIDDSVRRELKKKLTSKINMLHNGTDMHYLHRCIYMVLLSFISLLFCISLDVNVNKSIPSDTGGYVYMLSIYNTCVLLLSLACKNFGLRCYTYSAILSAGILIVVPSSWAEYVNTVFSSIISYQWTVIIVLTLPLICQIIHIIHHRTITIYNLQHIIEGEGKLYYEAVLHDRMGHREQMPEKYRAALPATRPPGDQPRFVLESLLVKFIDDRLVSLNFLDSIKNLTLGYLVNIFFEIKEVRKVEEIFEAERVQGATNKQNYGDNRVTSGKPVNPPNRDTSNKVNGKSKRRRKKTGSSYLSDETVVPQSNSERKKQETVRNHSGKKARNKVKKQIRG